MLFANAIAVMPVDDRAARGVQNDPPRLLESERVFSFAVRSRQTAVEARLLNRWANTLIIAFVGLFVIVCFVIIIHNRYNVGERFRCEFEHVGQKR